MLGVNLTSPAFVFFSFHKMKLLLVILFISASLKSLNQVCMSVYVLHLCRSFYYSDYKIGQNTYFFNGLYLVFRVFANPIPPKREH